MPREPSAPVEAVLLDAFGTLVTLEPPGPHLRAELAHRGVHVSEAAAASAFRAEIAHYLRHHLEGRDAASLDRLRDSCAQVIVDELAARGLDHAAARSAMLAALRFSPYRDAAPALRTLRGRGLALVVASNWDVSLPEALERTGLAALVDGVVASAQVGVTKPGRELFDAALELADTAPARALHVGDSIPNDVEGARAAGLRAVLMVRDDPLGEAARSLDVARGAPGVPAIRDLGDLASLL